MNLTLYKATELARLESHIDPETGEIDIASFEGAQLALADKQCAYAAVYKNKGLDVTGLKAMRTQVLSDIDTKIKAAETTQTRIKDQLRDNMKLTCTKSIEAVDKSFKATLHEGRDKAVIIGEGFIKARQFVGLTLDQTSTMAMESLKANCKDSFEAGYYYAMMQIKEPSKTLIEKAIESGEAITGASIVRNDRLEIK